jgi:lipid A 3-O-deacylase
MRLPIVLLLAAAATTGTPVSATELFVGLHKHAVHTPLSLSGGVERGVDLSVGVRFSPVGKLFSGQLQPYVFGALNSAGDTSYAAAGMSARFGLGGTVYVRPGLGLAIHNGSSARFDNPFDRRIEFGSRILFEPELAIGARLSKRVGLEASLVHMSHGTLFSRQNPGIDNLGARLSISL